MNRNHFLYKAFHPSYKRGFPTLKKIVIFGVALISLIVIIIIIVKAKKSKSNNNDKINEIKESNNKLQAEIN